MYKKNLFFIFFLFILFVFLLFSFIFFYSIIFVAVAASYFYFISIFVSYFIDFCFVGSVWVVTSANVGKKWSGTGAFSLSRILFFEPSLFLSLLRSSSLFFPSLPPFD